MEQLDHSDYYKLLGVSRGASEHDISKAYKRLAIRFHPDKNPQHRKQAEETFKKVREAEGVLRDPERRAAYDASLAERTRRPRYDREIDSPPSTPSARGRTAARFSTSAALPVRCLAVVSGELGEGGGAAVRCVYPPRVGEEMTAREREELAEAALPWERDATARANGGVESGFAVEGGGRRRPPSILKGPSHSYARASDFTFFTLPGPRAADGSPTELYGTSCLVASVATPMTAICALSTRPVYGLLHARLSTHCAALFQVGQPMTADEVGESLEELFDSVCAPCAIHSADMLAVGEPLDPRPLLVVAGADVLRALKLLLLESRLLLLPSGQRARAGQPPPPQPPLHLASSSALALASLLPGGLLPLGAHAACGCDPPPTEALDAWGPTMALLPAASCLHAAALHPSAAGWCAAAADESSGALLAPLAQALLPLRAAAPFAAADADGVSPFASELGSAALQLPERSLHAAAALTPHEAALVGRVVGVVRALPGREGVAWEGSADWVRACFHEHFRGLAADFSRHVLAGDAAPLEAKYGAAWVRAWAGSANFGRWSVRNKLGAAARLWRARLDGGGAPAAEAPAARKELPPAVAAGMSQVKAATGRAAAWLRQRINQDASSDTDSRPTSPSPADSSPSPSRPATAHGGLYFGAKQGGVAHGRGVIYRGEGVGGSFRGTVLMCEFTHGVAHGQGVELTVGAAEAAEARGRVLSVFRGELSNGVRHGFGRLVEPAAKARYVGQWRGGRFDGEGLWRCERREGGEGGEVREEYEGSWAEGVRHGFGVARRLTRKKGWEGRGEEGWEEEEKYEGEWHMGKQSGAGRCARADGSVYVGEWFDGHMHGAGTLRLADGREKEGWWAQSHLMCDTEAADAQGEGGGGEAEAPAAAAAAEEAEAGAGAAGGEGVAVEAGEAAAAREGGGGTPAAPGVPSEEAVALEAGRGGGEATPGAGEAAGEEVAGETAEVRAAAVDERRVREGGGEGKPQGDEDEAPAAAPSSALAPAAEEAQEEARLPRSSAEELAAAAVEAAAMSRSAGSEGLSGEAEAAVVGEAAEQVAGEAWNAAAEGVRAVQPVATPPATDSPPHESQPVGGEMDSELVPMSEAKIPSTDSPLRESQPEEGEIESELIPVIEVTIPSTDSPLGESQPLGGEIESEVIPVSEAKISSTDSALRESQPVGREIESEVIPVNEVMPEDAQALEVLPAGKAITGETAEHIAVDAPAATAEVEGATSASAAQCTDATPEGTPLEGGDMEQTLNAAADATGTLETLQAEGPPDSTAAGAAHSSP